MNNIVVILIVLFIAFASLVIVVSYNRDLSNHLHKLDNIQSKVYKSKFGDIEYLLEGEGPTVLISHGVTGGVDQGIGLAQAYFGGGYQLIYISRFGYLKSTMPKEASAKLQAAAYNELIDYLGIKNVYILGNSAGGPSASYFAIDYPNKCRGLILLSSAVPGAKVSSPPDFIFQSDFLYWFTTKLAGRGLMNMFVPPTIAKKLTKQQTSKLMDDVFMAALPISKRSKGVLFDNKVSTPSVDTIPFEQIKPPTLIIHAEDDPAPPISGARKIAEKVNGSNLVVFNGGHLILYHEEDIQGEIKKFVIKNNESYE
jgi:pimeloyl-ACP methyl ester carboxylesterase